MQHENQIKKMLAFFPQIPSTKMHLGGGLHCVSVYIERYTTQTRMQHELKETKTDECVCV